MSRVVAFEWSPEQLRVILARVRRNSVNVERLWSISLPSTPEERDQPETPLSAKLAEQIGEALGRLSVSRAEAFVVVSRAHVELRQLNLPPVPDEELPDIVRFQAAREFTSVEEDWPVDYLPLDSDPSQPRSVLAAAIQPTLLTRIEQVCLKHRLRLTRIGVRPFTAASLILRVEQQARVSPTLVVGLFADEADLSLLLDGQVVLSRCARLHGDPLSDEAGAADLIGQIRRTMAAGQGMLGSRRVEKVIVCGAGSAMEALANRLRGDLRQEVAIFDPSVLPAVAGVLEPLSKENLGQFVPLLGIIEEHIGLAPRSLDFVSPRRPPAPPSRRPYVVAGLLTSAFLLAGVFVYGYARDVALREEIRTLQSRQKALETREREVAQLEQRVEEIASWDGESINWLDELFRLATRLPGSQELMLRQIKCTSIVGGGQIELDGVARSLEAIRQAEVGLQDATHAVAGRSKNELPSPGHYRYEFRSAIRIQKQPEKTTQAPAGRAAATRLQRSPLMPRRGEP